MTPTHVIRWSEARTECTVFVFDGGIQAAMDLHSVPAAAKIYPMAEVQANPAILSDTDWVWLSEYRIYPKPE